MVPPHLDDEQELLFNRIVDTRARVLQQTNQNQEEKEKQEENSTDLLLFDECGALRGPWNAEVASPALGQHLERLATAVRTDNCLPDRIFEVAILAVGVHWMAPFEWVAHEKLARRAGISPVALALVKANAPPERLHPPLLQSDELAAYAFSRELALTKRVSEDTYRSTRAALRGYGGCHGGDRAMADLALTLACYHGVSVILNAFEVPLPQGHDNPFPFPSTNTHTQTQAKEEEKQA
jgi:4-carboxymuconolactone decarboxylase